MIAKAPQLDKIISKKSYHDFDLSKDEQPVIKVTVDGKDGDCLSVSGNMDYIRSKETIDFKGTLPDGKETESGNIMFKTASLTRRKTGKVLAVCENGKWFWVEKKAPMQPSLDMLDLYVAGAVSRY